LDAFRNKDFRLLWLGQTISSVGDQMFPVVIAVAILNRGGNATDLGMVLAARTLALVLFVLLGGVWADRVSRRQLMMAADTLRAAVVTGLAVAVLTTDVGVWFLAAMVFLIGAGEAFFRPAQGALLPSIVPRESRAASNAMMSVSLRAAAVIGPALGGLLVVTVGVGGALLLDAITFGWSLVMLYRLREPAYGPARRNSMVADLRDGFREVWVRPWVKAVLLLSMVHLALVTAPTTVLLPIIGRMNFHSDTAFSLSLAALAVGGLVGALAAAALDPRRPGVVSMLTLTLGSVVPLALLFPFAAWFVVLAHFLAGFAVEPLVIFWYTAIQNSIAPDKVARVLSLDWLATMALLPLALSGVGPAVDAAGITLVLTCALAASVLLPLLVLLVPGVSHFGDRVDAASPSDVGGEPQSG
jgi:DHA3 family tetracycline resistance protein-like MFS transporter